MEIITFEPNSDAWVTLISAVRQADETERKVSLCFQKSGHAQIKLGEGMWTPPLSLSARKECGATIYRNGVTMTDPGPCEWTLRADGTCPNATSHLD
jgi:hypothetical protein